MTRKEFAGAIQDALIRAYKNDPERVESLCKKMAASGRADAADRLRGIVQAHKGQGEGDALSVVR